MNNFKISNFGSLNFDKNSCKKSDNNKFKYFQNNNILPNKESINLKTSKKIIKSISLNEKNKTKKLTAITREINKELSNLNFNITPLNNNFFISLHGKRILNFKYLDILKSSSNDLIKLLIKMHNLRLDIYNLPNILHGAGLGIDTAIIDFSNTIYLLEDLGVNNKNISVLNYCGSKIGSTIEAIANNINQFNELGFNNKEMFNIFKNKGLRIEKIINHFFSNITFLKYLELDNKCLASIMRSNSPRIEKIIDRLYNLYNQFAKEIDLLNTNGVNKILIYETTFKLSNNNYQEFLSLLKEFSNIFDINNFRLYHDEKLNISMNLNHLLYIYLLDQFKKLNVLINLLSAHNNTFLNKILSSLKIFINDMLEDVNSKVDLESYQVVSHNTPYYSQEEVLDKNSLSLSFESYNEKARNKRYHSLSFESYNHENNSTFPLSENNDSNSIGNILNENFIEDNDSINIKNSIFNLDKNF
ncbi:MAG TPA: hypothetical protein PKD00_05540 [Burkholderiales bacterium]|nr:hypothetical protein [Burkholderiales bacterium]